MADPSMVNKGTINCRGILITSVGIGHWKCSYERKGVLISRIISDGNLIDKVRIGNKTALAELKYRIRVGY